MTRSIWAVIQARTGSSRLPGKVLADIGGKPMLQRVIERVTSANSLDGTVVATTTERTDDPIVDLLANQDVPVLRGSQDDVLDRYHDALVVTGADVVVRITSDCPLIDPSLLDAVVHTLDVDADYASNTLEPRTFPRGLDVEAITAGALEQAWLRDRDPASREHVTPYVYRHPDEFTLRRVANDRDQSHHRWTVDTAEDLALVRRIHDALRERTYSWHDVLDLVKAHPDWSALNQHVEQKQVP